MDENNVKMNEQNIDYIISLICEYPFAIMFGTIGLCLGIKIDKMNKGGNK